MENQNNQENTSFNDHAKSDRALKSKPEQLRKGVVEDMEERGGDEYSKNLMSKPDQEVRENEDASLQDESYSFDEQNTDNEEYHDADGAEDFDLDNDDDFVQ